MTDTEINTDPPADGWRFRIGIALFTMGLLSPLFVPLVTATNLSTEWKTTMSGLLLLGIPELLWLIAAAVMGKSGFDYIKSKAFGFVRKHVLPDSVSPMRYRIGLILLFLPLLFGWLAPYAPQLVPTYGEHPFRWLVGGDLLVLASLLVLGGEFWDKLRALFVYGAGATVPKSA
jgi:hypothetical protein